MEEKPEEKVVVAEEKSIKDLYPKNFTTEKMHQTQLIQFMLQEQLTDKNSPISAAAKILAAKAWNTVAKRAFDKTSTDETVNKLAELNKQAAKLATVSHRIALNGPAGWNVQGANYYDKNATNEDIQMEMYRSDISSRAYQYQRSIQMLYNDKQMILDQLEQATVFLHQNQDDVARFQQELRCLESQANKNVKQQRESAQINLAQANELAA